jgi:hypothetical protein
VVGRKIGLERVKQLNHFPVQYRSHFTCTPSLTPLSNLTALSLDTLCYCRLLFPHSNLSLYTTPPTCHQRSLNTRWQFKLTTYGYSSINWQTDATFNSFYFLSNYSLNMFRAKSAHHQELSLLYKQPAVICVAACPWHCLVIQQDSAMYRQTDRQTATQIAGGCMYCRDKTPDDERMSLEKCWVNS